MLPGYTMRPRCLNAAPALREGWREPVEKALHAIAAQLPRPPPPPHPPYAGHTHEGGVGGIGKENQVRSAGASSTLLAVTPRLFGAGLHPCDFFVCADYRVRAW